MEKNITEFHSGRRLSIARRLRGWTQEEIITLPGFPHIESRGFRHWESKGIPSGHIMEVAEFFKIIY